MIHSPQNPLDAEAISRETAAYRLFCKHPTQPHTLSGLTMGGRGRESPGHGVSFLRLPLSGPLTFYNVFSLLFHKMD